MAFEITELVTGGDGEPRMSAALLAKRLGMGNRQAMMRLIERSDAALRRFGGFLATVAKNPSVKGGGPTKDYLLNEGQALFIASRSETALGSEVLIGLIEVFMAWRHGRLGPVTSEADRVRLEANRAYYQSVPESTKAIAAQVVAALRQVEARIAQGVSRNVSIAEIGRLTGMAVRTIYGHWSKVRMVPEVDWLPAVVRLYHQKRGMLAECHPEALRLFTDLRAAGVKISLCYARVLAVAEERGWLPVPCERTLRRYCKAALAVTRAA